MQNLIKPKLVTILTNCLGSCKTRYLKWMCLQHYNLRYFQVFFNNMKPVLWIFELADHSHVLWCQAVKLSQEGCIRPARKSIQQEWRALPQRGKSLCWSTLTGSTYPSKSVQQIGELPRPSTATHSIASHCSEEPRRRQQPHSQKQLTRARACSRSIVVLEPVRSLSSGLLFFQASTSLHNLELFLNGIFFYKELFYPVLNQY